MAEENLKQFKDEVIRHFDVVAEDIKDKIGILSEQVSANTEKLEEHDKRFDKIEDDLGVIKLDIEVIKNDLKQKVSRDEFVILEKRVSALEARRP
jgi:peptidoglycan hydrolase CwlO-like protein